MRKFRMHGALAGLAFFGIVNSVQAQPIMIGSFTFDENASADVVGNTTGDDIRTFLVDPLGPFHVNEFSLELVLTDDDVNTGAFCQAPCTIELLFADNAVVNGAGDDLILFEQGFAESTIVTINGTTVTIASFVNEAAVLDAQDNPINIYGIDLDDFGVAGGGTIIPVLLDLFFDNPNGDATFPSSDVLGLFALNSIDTPTPLVLCEGFAPPMADYPITVRKKRALPLRAELIGVDGLPLTDADLTASPVLQVLFSASGSALPPMDMTEFALPAGQGTDGNNFVFQGGHWAYNLLTSNYSAPGSYTIKILSGDQDQYRLGGILGGPPTCEATFVVEE